MCILSIIYQRNVGRNYKSSIILPNSAKCLVLNEVLMILQTFDRKGLVTTI